MSNEASFTLSPALAWLIAFAALLASPALIVMAPSTLSVLQESRLDGLGDRGGLPKLDDGSGN